MPPSVAQPPPRPGPRTPTPAGLWQRAFDAKTCSLNGDPEQVLTRPEARARLRLAGLDPDLA